MILVRMHTARRNESHQVAGAAALLQPGDHAGERRHLLDRACCDGVADTRQVLHQHAAGANVKVTDLGIAHLPVRQADILAGGAQQRRRA